MISNFLTRNIRRYLVGSKQQFVFKKVVIDEFTIPNVQRLGLYIHIPFCKSICPYCPYNKIKYDKALALPYLDAVLQEIELYHQRLGMVEISSVYIGGGTPTNMIDEIEVMLQTIKEKFLLVGDICIETSVAEINQTMVEKFKACGIQQISLGVQSFQDKNLAFLGRNYKQQAIKPAFDVLKNAGFKSINIDLMFALTSQTIDDVRFDLEQAIALGVDQITAYPLFTFPYTSVGSYLQLKKLKMPNIFVRRKMYRMIHNFLIERGFTRVSVWGFKKGMVPRYSSVTRDFYVGLGAGAASSFQDKFYFNTFSVSEYITRLSQGKLPVALSMDITKTLAQYYWFYWKLYDTYISLQEMRAVFGEKSKAEKLIQLFRFFGLCKNIEGQISLTERGSFWIHLAQNYFILNYINKVWTIAMKNPWPDDIEL